MLAEFVSAKSVRNLTQLYTAIEPPSLAELQEAVAVLLRAQKLCATYRVHSPFGERHGVADFKSFLEIPKTLEDDDDDEPRPFEVGLADIEVLFSPNGAEGGEGPRA